MWTLVDLKKFRMISETKIKMKIKMMITTISIVFELSSGQDLLFSIVIGTVSKILNSSLNLNCIRKDPDRL